MWATLFPALMKMIGGGSAMGGVAGGAAKGGVSGSAGGNVMGQIMGMLGKGGGQSSGGGGQSSGNVMGQIMGMLGQSQPSAQPSAAPVVQAGMAEAFKRGLSAQNLLTQITSKDTYVDDLLRDRMRSRVR